MESRLRPSFVPAKRDCGGSPTRSLGDAAPSPRLGSVRGGGAAAPTQRVGDNTLHLEHGFTLLEILLAIALIGLLAGVLVTGSVNLLSDKPATPEDVFWKAVRQSRATALSAEREVRLSFDDKQQAFVLDDGSGPSTLAVPPAPGLIVDFLSAQAGRGAVLIGGDLMDTQTVPSVSFYPDGTCSPFRVQFRAGGAAHVLAIDPWTCAPVLPRLENSS